MTEIELKHKTNKDLLIMLVMVSNEHSKHLEHIEGHLQRLNNSVDKNVERIAYLDKRLSIIEDRQKLKRGKILGFIGAIITLIGSFLYGLYRIFEYLAK